MAAPPLEDFVRVGELSHEPPVDIAIEHHGGHHAS